MKYIFALIGLSFALPLSAQKDSTITKRDRKKDVLLETTLGNIVVRLSDSTPLHRDNFLKLVSLGYYDSVLFHRIIKNFMIQAGDPDSKHAKPGEPLATVGPRTEFLQNSKPLYSIKKE
ncbi:MAG TPA: peptidylprolyl isomerase [Chitinophagaceae bacterium]